MSMRRIHIGEMPTVIEARCARGCPFSPFEGSFALSVAVSSKSVPFEDAIGEGSAMSLGLESPGDF